ncbi:MAG: hypothetical protein C4522_08930 [Desulfobacteraceae bacterium]|nr:MAG: hypothetical protein C4522_08930 [Desulfobacteraceae bacterium]
MICIRSCQSIWRFRKAGLFQIISYSCIVTYCFGIILYAQTNNKTETGMEVPDIISRSINIGLLFQEVLLCGNIRKKQRIIF